MEGGSVEREKEGPPRARGEMDTARGWKGPEVM